MKSIAVFLLILLVGCAPELPPAFSGDLITVTESCASSSTYAYKVGESIFKSVNGDKLLRCLYASDVTLVFHGDPVVMREQEQTP